MFKAVWQWHKNKHKDHWNRIDGPEKNPHIYGPSIYKKGTRIKNGENTDFLISGAGKPHSCM